jgi:hypothetical protein
MSLRAFASLCTSRLDTNDLEMELLFFKTTPWSQILNSILALKHVLLPSAIALHDSGFNQNNQFPFLRNLPGIAK